MQQYEGKRVRGPNGEEGVIRNGQLVILSEGSAVAIPPPSFRQVVATPPKEPTPQTASQIAKDKADAALAAGRVAQLPTEAQLAALKVENARLENDRLKREASGGGNRKANLDAVGELLKTVRGLYDTNIKGKGIGSVIEYIPTPTNREFDTAAAGLSEAALAALRVPGVGSQSDRELAAFIEANKPAAGDYDEVIERKLENIRTRIDAHRAEVGLPKLDWPVRKPNVGGVFVDTGEPGPLAVDVTDDRRPGESDEQYLARIQAGEAGAAPPPPPPPSGPAPGNPVVAGLIGAGDVLSLGTLDEIAAGIGAVVPNGAGNSIWQGETLKDAYDLNLQQTDAYKKDIAEQRPVATLTGQIGSLFAGGLGLPGRLKTALTSGGRAARLGKVAGAESAFGAAYGAGYENDNRLIGAGVGAVVAPVASAAGQATVKGVSRVLSPRVKPVVDRLKRAGLTMTAGQIMGQGGFVGRVVKRLEDSATSIPLVGDAINNSRRAGIEQLNRAVVEEALAPIGAKLPANRATGHDAVEFAQEIVAQAYDEALKPLRAQADEPFVAGLASAGLAAAKLPRQQREAGEAIIQRDVLPFVPEDGVFTGEQIQNIKRGLEKQIYSFRSKGSPSDELLADTLQELRDEFMGFVSRAAPEQAEAFRAADAAYGGLVIAERAAAKAKGGVFSPEQLRVAVRQSDRTVRKRATAAGRARMQGLSDAASEVLPSSVPDSGTAGRLALPALALGGAGGGYAYDGTGGALAGAALLSAPYSPVGRRAIQVALTGRPIVVRKAGSALDRLAPVVGRAGAVSALGSIAQ